MKTDHQKLIYSKMWWFWKLFTACEGNKNVENNKRDIHHCPTISQRMSIELNLWFLVKRHRLHR